MSSDKDHIHRDIFGDDDDEEDEYSQQRDDRNSPSGDNNDEYRGDGAHDNAEPKDGEEEEEDDEPQLPSFRKRNADGSSPPPEPKKKKLASKKKADGGASRDDAANETTSDPRDLKLQKLDRDFELALKSGKTSSRRRRKDEEEDIDNELDASAARFVGKMRDAAFADIDAKLKKESALAKVRMLESVKRQLNKSHVHNTFLDNGILEVMKLWLEPLQDASLPSLDIIQDFLDILDILPIQTDHLVNSGVGRVVYFYTKVDDSRVTPSIKRAAHALVDKWSRPIVKLSQDYRDKKINYADEEPSASQNRKRPDHSRASASSSSDAPGPRTMGVRVPQIDRGAYAFMPESAISFDKSRGGKSDKYKKLKSHMAKMKQVKRS
ncbi:Transcription factor iws1 [Podila clonocystis]|nr:Transcription factor iws1 [Podila clonocystis]